MELSFPTKAFRTHGGAHVPHHKNTSMMPTVEMPAPARVVLPMQQHIGAPCVPAVKKGDHVYVGTVVGEAQAFVCAPIHASVSGTVHSVEKVALSNGALADAVIIDSDGLMEPDPNLCPPQIRTKEDLIQAARDCGLVGLGGAGFPTHVKLNVPADKKIDTLIINVAECEPFVTADHREAIENGWDLLSGVYLLKRMLEIDRVIIAVENNKPDVIDILRRIADDKRYDPDDRVHVLPLPARYPQGAEKVLIHACTGRDIPTGGLPADVGCIVMNISSAAALARYVETGMPLVKRRVTIDGSAIAEPKNVFVPLGTSIHDVIEFCGGYSKPVKKLISGGPMMGFAITDDSFPVLKSNNAFLAFEEKDAIISPPTACIRCGRCVQACPMNLVPTMLEKYTEMKNTEKLQELDIMTCMECGCCAYSCPAHHRLVQSMRVGKALVKNAGRKS